MKRHTIVNSGRKNSINDGEKQLSQAARAAMARASGHSNAEGARRPSTLHNFRMKLRSIYYKAVYSTVISGNPTNQRDKADTIFRRSLLGIGCLCFMGVYLPLILLRYFILDDAPPQGMTELGKLKHQSFLHGVFYFGRTSHEMPRSSKSFRGPITWNKMQRKNLDDEKIYMKEEQERCDRYNIHNTLSQRRRLFLGTTIAGNSMEIMEAIGAEAYNVFHTFSVIESNMTQDLRPRNWTHGLQSDNLMKAQRMFGPKTKVSVDYYVRALNYIGPRNTLHVDGNFKRWNMNGMGPDDVVVITNSDETFSRDFLRALQICDFPELRHDQPCNESKILANVVTYEGSPNCGTKSEMTDVETPHLVAILARCADQPRGENPKDRIYKQEDGFDTGYRFRVIVSNAKQNISKCVDSSATAVPMYFLKD